MSTREGQSAPRKPDRRKQSSVVTESGQPLPSAEDCYLFNAGEQERAWQFMGANHRVLDGSAGVQFVVWAPNAARVAVVGEFNDWDGRVHPLQPCADSGLWSIFIPGLVAGQCYKYEIHARSGEVLPWKADPYARSMELRPGTASRIPDNEDFAWQDQDWLQQRAERDHGRAAISIYELHAGSWRRKVEEGNRFLSYRELADELIPYVSALGFTHIQFMPLSEFPFDGSWGYQPLGLFAPSARFGTAADLKYLINAAHRAGIGVLLDWVPGHFPTDAHGLARFDGTCLYEHEDPRRGFHPDWNTLIYDYSRREVISYLLSNVFYWLSEFHVDGLRFDAVASMLYLDYSREEGEWLANHHGGRENLDAIELLRSINQRAYFNFPGILMIAEESTAWPGVTDFTDRGGLGFGFKWNLGWMNDTLSYMSRDPVHRRFHHNELTFGLLYAFSEHFILPLSHDEVVHGKRSLIARMPGDDWQRFAGLRAYYAFMWTHPGKKLLFMGGEFAQCREWNHDQSLDWHLLEQHSHQGIQRLVTDLNRLYRSESALHRSDCDAAGFVWIDADNHAASVFVYGRYNRDRSEFIIIVSNMTPVLRSHLRIGVPEPGYYEEQMNTDSELYGGSGQGNFGGCWTEALASHGHADSLCLTLPPLATLVFKRRIEERKTHAS